VDSHLDISAIRGANKGMSSKPDMPDQTPDPRKGRPRPVWAEGLRRMYDEVVEESLPDDFVDLLKKLDQSSDQT
jgi:hypothetical protein